MTARLPSLTELDRRVREVERDAGDVRGLVMDVGARTHDNTDAVKHLTEDFGTFFGQWKASGLATFAEEWKKFRAEEDAEKAAAKAKSERDTQQDLAQDARLARLEQAGQKIADGAERAENAAPAFAGAMDKLDKLAVPPRNASLRQWAIFLFTGAIAVWEILRTMGVVK